MYYMCSENKGADQLRGYHEAMMRTSLIFENKNSYLAVMHLLCK